MDDENYKNVVALAKNEVHINKVFYTLSEKRNVPDPYFGGNDGFIKVYEMLDPKLSASGVKTLARAGANSRLLYIPASACQVVIPGLRRSLA